MSDINSRDDLNYTTEDADEFTLESILAEFKGSAYIDGDRKTSPDLLDERIRHIMDEVKDGNIGDMELYSFDSTDNDFFADIGEPEGSSGENKTKVTAEKKDIPVINELSPEDKKLAVKTADIQWEPVKAATSFDEARREMQAFFAKRDEAVKRQEEELLEKRREELRIREEERRKKEAEQLKAREAKRMEQEKRAALKQQASENPTVDAGNDVEKASPEEAVGELFIHDAETDITDEEVKQPATDEDNEEKHEPEILFFDNYRYADSDSGETVASDGVYMPPEDDWDENNEEAEQNGFFARLFRRKDRREKAPEQETEGLGEQNVADQPDEFIPEDDGEEAPEKKEGFFARLFAGSGKASTTDNDEYADEYSSVYPEDYETDDEDDTEAAPVFEPEMEPEVYIEEPDFAEEGLNLGKRCRVLMVKSRLGLFLSLLMAVLTFMFERGFNIPFIAGDLKLVTAVLVIMQLIVMMLSMEILKRGFLDIMKRAPGAESLVLFSNVVTYLSCCFYLYSGNTAMGAPFCAVAAFSAAFSMWGEYRCLGAMSLSLKTAVSVAQPKGLSCEYNKDMDRTIIKRHSEGRGGFYNNLVESDASETTYRYFAIFILFAAVLLSVVSAIGSECAFMHCFSAVSAACASFTALSAFAVPFSTVARKLRKDGSAVAGWGGADDIYYADGVRITDSDIFPGGALVTGVKVFDSLKSDKVIRYTSSLMMETGSDLAPAFTDFLNKQGLVQAKIESFDCTEGGVCGVIRGERVICGTAACMALFGIRIPQELNVKNAMYTAINDELSGAFTIYYAPSRMVQSALLTTLRTKVKLFFAMRDFNITPLMVQQKLQIPVDDIEYLPTHDAYMLTEDRPTEIPHSAAVLARDIPSTFAETIAFAKKLRNVTMVNTALSVLTTLLGMVIMFFMCWRGNVESVSPTNLTEYMLAMELVILIVSRTVTLI